MRPEMSVLTMNRCRVHRSGWTKTDVRKERQRNFTATIRYRKGSDDAIRPDLCAVDTSPQIGGNQRQRSKTTRDRSIATNSLNGCQPTTYGGLASGS